MRTKRAAITQHYADLDSIDTFGGLRTTFERINRASMVTRWGGHKLHITLTQPRAELHGGALPGVELRIAALESGRRVFGLRDAKNLASDLGLRITGEWQHDSMLYVARGQWMVQEVAS